MYSCAHQGCPCAATTMNLLRVEDYPGGGRWLWVPLCGCHADPVLVAIANWLQRRQREALERRHEEQA